MHGRFPRGPVRLGAPTARTALGGRSRSTASTRLPRLIAQAAEPLPAIDAPGFAAAFDRFARCRVVLLGESSHGTSEFYRARAAITRRLVVHHGFTFVAVEADWPDAAALNRHVRRLPAPAGAEAPFQRFPAWMWRNTDVAEFIDWLRACNRDRTPLAQVGFHGLDLYNMRAAMATVLHYLDHADPRAAAAARERYACLAPWQDDPARYGHAVLAGMGKSCEDATGRQCRELLARQARSGGMGHALLDAAHSARLVASAERYYRVMYHGGADAWNLRDTHMFETLEQLLATHGPQSRAVVWAHNSHIGDARHTDMGWNRGEINLGQLCRERFGARCALVGFGTHCGTVTAAHAWDGEGEVMTVQPSRPGSIERACHDSGVERFLLDLRAHADHEMRVALLPPRLQRFIGVIYRPSTELYSHYAEASLPCQYDAWAWFDQTRAVSALPHPHDQSGVPETFPFAL